MSDPNTVGLQLLGTWSRPCVPGASFTPCGPIGPCGPTPPRGAYGSPSVTYSGPNIPYGPPSVTYGGSAGYRGGGSAFGDPGASISSPAGPIGPISSTGRNGITASMNPIGLNAQMNPIGLNAQMNPIGNSYGSLTASGPYGNPGGLYSQPSSPYANMGAGYQFQRLPYNSPAPRYMGPNNGIGDYNFQAKDPRATFSAGAGAYYGRGFTPYQMPTGPDVSINQNSYPAAFTPQPNFPSFIPNNTESNDVPTQFMDSNRSS